MCGGFTESSDKMNSPCCSAKRGSWPHAEETRHTATDIAFSKRDRSRHVSCRHPHPHQDRRLSPLRRAGRASSLTAAGWSKSRTVPRFATMLPGCGKTAHSWPRAVCRVQVHEESVSTCTAAERRVATIARGDAIDEKRQVQRLKSGQSRPTEGNAASQVVAAPSIQWHDALWIKWGRPLKWGEGDMQPASACIAGSQP